jgi:outer membrane receptor protein involved in Fe transport
MKSDEGIQSRRDLKKRKEECMRKEERMRKGGFFLIGLCFISLILFSSAWAEDIAMDESQKDYQVYDLGDIFVTSEKPPAVQETIILNRVTAEEIEATNSRTVAEALSHVPGIRVSTGRKNFASVQIHGLDQNRFLVLIDGVPYYETKYGGLDLSQIPVDNVAEIVVSKGAASVLYGANALIGAINIITKKPTEKPSVEGLLEIGNNGYIRESVSHGMKVGIFNYWLNFGHQQADSWRMSSKFDPEFGAVTFRPGPRDVPTILENGSKRENSDYETYSFWGKVGVEPNPNSEYYANFHIIEKEKGDPPSTLGGTVINFFPAFSRIFDRITKYDDWGIDLSGQQKIFEPLTLKGKLFYHDHTDDYTSYSDQLYHNEIAVSRYKDYIFGGTLLADVRPIDWDIVRLSFHYKGDSHKQRDDERLPFDEYFSRTGSAGLENEFNLIKRLSVVIGVSYDWYDVTKAKALFEDDDNPSLDNPENWFLVKAPKPDSMEEFCPMIGATYNLFDATRLYGSAAHKIRFPTLDQFYSSSGGNLNLKPEVANNYTLGVSQLFSHFAKAELAGFYHDLKDFISRDSDPRLNPESQYQNFAKIQLTGFELFTELYPVRDLVLYGAYTYNHARDKSSGRVTDLVRNIPQYKVDVGGYYTIPYIRTRVDLVGIYMAKIYNQLPTPASVASGTVQRTLTKSYFTADARISQPFGKYFEAYLAMNNIFDRDYESEDGFPGKGRNFYFGVSGKF